MAMSIPYLEALQRQYWQDRDSIDQGWRHVFDVLRDLDAWGAADSGDVDALAMLPLAVPGLILAFGYLALTRRGSFLAFLDPARNPLILLVLAYAVRRLPYVVRSAAAGFEQASVTLEEAAQNLGASPIRALKRITLPLIMANLFSGGILAFAFAMLEVSDSLVLAQKQADYPIAKAIYELANILGEGPYLAAALGVWAMAFLGLTIAAASRSIGVKLGALFRG